MRANKKDTNHKQIVAHAQSLGFGTIDVSMMKNFCDEIWIGRNGSVFFIEIKDGSKSPSKRMLTDGEIGFKNKLKSIGGSWHLIETEKDVNELWIQTQKEKNYSH